MVEKGHNVTEIYNRRISNEMNIIHDLKIFVDIVRHPALTNEEKTKILTGKVKLNKNEVALIMSKKVDLLKAKKILPKASSIKIAGKTISLEKKENILKNVKINPKPNDNKIGPLDTKLANSIPVSYDKSSNLANKNISKNTVGNPSPLAQKSEIDMFDEDIDENFSKEKTTEKMIKVLEKITDLVKEPSISTSGRVSTQSTQNLVKEVKQRSDDKFLINRLQEPSFGRKAERITNNSEHTSNNLSNNPVSKPLNIPTSINTINNIQKILDSSDSPIHNLPKPSNSGPNLITSNIPSPNISDRLDLKPNNISPTNTLHIPFRIGSDSSNITSSKSENNVTNENKNSTYTNSTKNNSSSELQEKEPHQTDKKQSTDTEDENMDLDMDYLFNGGGKSNVGMKSFLQKRLNRIKPYQYDSLDDSEDDDLSRIKFIKFSKG